MSDLRKAAERTLRWLDSETPTTVDAAYAEERAIAEALRAALAQEQAEPVSAADLVQRIRELRDEAAKMFIESGSPGYKLHDLYRMKLDAILVAPPQQPEPAQEPLTDDEIMALWERHIGPISFARAIERKVREKRND